MSDTCGQLGALNRTQSAACTVTVQAKNDVSEGTRFVSATASTSDKEITLDNNTSSTDVAIASSPPQNDTSLPSLSLQVNNNVGKYVNPKDVVTFEVNLKNTGDGVSHKTAVYQSLYDQEGVEIGSTTFNLGTIPQGAKGTLRFGIVVPPNIDSNKLTTVTYAVGLSESDEEVNSEDALTSFAVNLKNYKIASKTYAADEFIPPILGVTDSTTATRPFPLVAFIVLLVSLSTLTLVLRHRRVVWSTLKFRSKIIILSSYFLMIAILGFTIFTAEQQYHLIATFSNHLATLAHSFSGPLN